MGSKGDPAAGGDMGILQEFLCSPAAEERVTEFRLGHVVMPLTTLCKLEEALKSPLPLRAMLNFIRKVSTTLIDAVQKPLQPVGFVSPIVHAGLRRLPFVTLKEVLPGQLLLVKAHFTENVRNAKLDKFVEVIFHFHDIALSRL